MTVRIINRGEPNAAVVEFAAWLAKATKGESYVYHKGWEGNHERWTFLAASRSTDLDPQLIVYINTVGGAAHKAYLDGLVHLFQRTDGTGLNDYIAVRR